MVTMAIPHTMEEEGGNNNAAGHGGNEDLDLPEDVSEDLQVVMNAAEDGDAPSLSTALANLTSGVDCEGEDGDRPLHVACLYGNPACVQILLTAGASIEVRDEDGDNPCMMHAQEPLHLAARSNHSDVVQLLLASGANPKISNLVGQCPVDLADPNSPAQVRLKDTVEKLIAEATES